MKLRSPSNSSAPRNVARQQSISRDNSESDIAENSPYGSFAFISISIHAPARVIVTKGAQPDAAIE